MKKMIDKAAVLARCSAGLRYSEVAREFGCTRAYVHLLAKRDGMPPRSHLRGKVPDLARRMQIVDLLLLGKKQDAIGAKLGCSQGHVSSVGIAAGLRRSKRSETRVV